MRRLLVQVIAGAVVALAFPSMVRAQAPNHFIQIKRCDPERQVSAAPPYYGYGPAYYPPAPYYWRDPYGYRYYQPNVIVNEAGVLYIDYVNVTPKVMGTIEFGLVANGRLVAEVRDVGTFSPHAEIKHQFGLNPNVFPLQTGLPVCVPLRIEFKDGTVWHNPHLPALRRELYPPQ